MCNKTAGVFERLSDLNIDVCFLTETWLRKGDTSKIAEVKDLGFNIIHQSRAGRGGGVAIASRKNLRVTRTRTKSYKSFELIEGIIKSSSGELLRLCCVYRSCTAKLSNVKDFCRDFDDNLDNLMHLPGKPMIAGDFNIHLEHPSDPETRKFTAVLSNYGLTQHCHSETHIAGGIRDLVLTMNNICDNLNVENLNNKIKNIDLDKFKNDLLLSDINNVDKFKDCNSAMDLYDSELSRILDLHAPLIEFSVNPEQSKWVDTKCQTARQIRRKAERDHKRLQSDDSKETLKKAIKHAATVINKTRDGYYRGRLKDSEGNKKDTYNIVNQLMDRDLTKDIIPTNKPDNVLCKEMQEFFKEKVDKIYSDMDSNLTDEESLDSSPDS